MDETLEGLLRKLEHFGLDPGGLLAEDVDQRHDAGMRFFSGLSCDILVVAQMGIGVEFGKMPVDFAAKLDKLLKIFRALFPSLSIGAKFRPVELFLLSSPLFQLLFPGFPGREQTLHVPVVSFVNRCPLLGLFSEHRRLRGHRFSPYLCKSSRLWGFEPLK